MTGARRPWAVRMLDPRRCPCPQCGRPKDLRARVCEVCDADRRRALRRAAQTLEFDTCGGCGYGKRATDARCAACRDRLRREGVTT